MLSEQKHLALIEREKAVRGNNSGSKNLPFCQGDRAAVIVGLSIDEMALELMWL